MYYHPCAGCIVDKRTCEKRLVIKASLAGLSVTSIKFKCKERTPRFKSGQRVSFPWSICVGQDYEGEGVFQRVFFNGTIIKEAAKPTKFTVRVDQDGEGYTVRPQDVKFKGEGRVVNVKATTMTPINEPDVNFCESCLKYEGESEGCQSFLVNGCDRYVAHGCLDAKE